MLADKGRALAGVAAVALALAGCFVPNPSRIFVRDEGPSEPVEEAATDAVAPPDALDALDAADASDVADVADARDSADAADARDAADAQDVVLDAVAPVECRRDERRCGDRCFRIDEDPMACGRCTTVCPTGDPCVAGVCSTPAPSTTMCPMPDGTMHSTDVSRDPENCGTCNTRCGRLEVCAAGTCRCLVGLNKCPSDTTGTCVDLQTSNAFCGDCMTRCERGQFCRNGACETIAAPRLLYPETCAQRMPPPSNEERVTLYLGNNSTQPFTARCQDVATGPTTWIEFSSTLTNETYLPPYGAEPTYVAGSAGAGMPGLRSTFSRARFERIDASRVGLLVQDNPTAVHTGWRWDGVVRRSAFFGVVSGCRDDLASTASVNLGSGMTNRFVIASTWSTVGAGVVGTSELPPGEVTRAQLSSRGCGGLYPDGEYTPYRPMYVRLSYRAP